MALKKIQYDVNILSTETVTQANMPVVYTNDLNSAEFVFNIVDMTTEQLAGATATTMLYMRDGSFFQNSDVHLNGNTFTYLLKESEGNHVGLAKIQLVVKVGTIEYATQLYSFEVVSGLETKVAKVAVEVMIKDWTTLTREAQAYIAQFLLDEEGRKATFVANEQDRQLAFEEAEELRQQKETERQEAESKRIEDEALRQAGYDADHGRAASDHIVAETDHTTAVADHTMVQGYNTRLTAEETATANNKISAVKGKTFADVDARFEDVEADTTLMGTNCVTNGDFSNGTTGWKNEFASLSVANNILSVTANGTGNSGRAYQTLTYIQNHKYYVNAKLKVTSSLCTSISYKYEASSVTVVTSPVANQIYSTSAVISPVGSLSYIQFIHNYPDASTASGKVMEVQNATLIDLTATFGVGNEPTAEQMDAIMAKFPNSWFDGTRNLFRASETLKKQITLYKEKANKVQEAWITPTLINGWYAIRPAEPPQYMKDEFGFVHFRGVIAKKAESQSNIPFSLPQKYTPTVNTTFNLTNIAYSSLRSLAVTIFTNGNVDFAGAPIGTESWYALSSINFKGG